MSRLSSGYTIVLFVLLAILTLGLILTIDRIDTLERQINQEVGKIADDFLQEDDFYPILDEVYGHLENIWQRLEYLEERR